MEEPSITELPDDLILKIFSLLPFFEESTVTRLLTKLRMEGPWKLVPVVMFDDNHKSYNSFVTFVYGSSMFNKSQILKRFHLKLSGDYSASDINFLVKLAVDRSVRKLRIQKFGKPLELPSCLSTCVTLKSLILHQVRISIVPPCFRLPSLKSLHLFSVQFSRYDSLGSLLQSCRDLEYLVVRDMMLRTLPHSFNLSSLKSLHLLSSSFWKHESLESLLRICPVLEDLVVRKTNQVFINSCWRTSIPCTTLKTLILREVRINDVPRSFCMPALKTMHLLSVEFSGGKSVAYLLQKCPVLEDLVVNQTEVFPSKVFTLSSCTTLKTLVLSEISIKHPFDLPWFRLPSLKKLHLLSVKFSGEASFASFLPICPVLECLVVDQTKDDSVVFNDVPHRFCLPSLKSLHLISVKFSGDKSFAKLIQSCPVLEDLVINEPEMTMW